VQYGIIHLSHLISHMPSMNVLPVNAPYLVTDMVEMPLQKVIRGTHHRNAHP